jgi:hypothetical protein
MGRISSSLSALALAGTSARAQSINVSFGHTSGAPSSSYAAAGAAGHWNAVSGVAGPSYPLVAIDGSATSVSLSQGPTTTVIAATDPAVHGDDAALLDFGLVTTGAETCLTFSGVAPGTYEVLVYAWLPNQPTVKSRTRQDQAPSTIDVGGAWSGAHVEGVTYARYIATVDSSGVLPAHSGLVTPNVQSAALNGVQFRFLPAGAPDAGFGGGGGNDAGTGTGAHHHAGCRASTSSSGALFALAIVVVVARRRRGR